MRYFYDISGPTQFMVSRNQHSLWDIRVIISTCMRYFSDISGPTQCVSRPRLCRRYKIWRECISDISSRTPELTAVSAVRRSGDCISPASSLLLSSLLQSCSPAEHRDSLQRPGSATTSGPGPSPVRWQPGKWLFGEIFGEIIYFTAGEIQARLDLPADSFLSWFLLDCYKKNIARY